MFIKKLYNLLYQITPASFCYNIHNFILIQPFKEFSINFSFKDKFKGTLAGLELKDKALLHPAIPVCLYAGRRGMSVCMSLRHITHIKFNVKECFFLMVGPPRV